MYIDLEIIIGLSFLYTVRCMLYKRDKPLSYWNMLSLACIIGWMVLALDYLNKSRKYKNKSRQKIQPSEIFRDPDEWDGTFIYPSE
jgi:hypothetical protein